MEKPEIKQTRLPGLDAVRSLAVACVILVHAISYTGVMDKDPTTLAWSVYLALRFIAITGVPLFLILSGYLCIGKKLSRGYYAGIIPILISYFAITAIAITATEISVPGTYTVFTAILGMLNFTAHGYAWYVEMYIGLFLLIPFLNILWQTLETRGKRTALIITLIGLTVLPSTVPSFHLFGTKLDILPDYWTAIYPLTFYFIGAYLREYPPKLTAWQKIVFAVAATALPWALCFVKTRIDGSYAWYMMNGFSSLTAMLTGIAYFVLLADINPPRAVNAVIKQISLCSFEMYLFSYITDKIVVSRILGGAALNDSILLLLIFVCSFIMSFVMSFVFRLAARPLSAWLVRTARKEKTSA